MVASDGKAMVGLRRPGRPFLSPGPRHLDHGYGRIALSGKRLPLVDQPFLD
jgi:hypothetical protein